MQASNADLLDQLFGPERNMTKEERVRAGERDVSDPKSCKFYMCGFCPYDLFINTKSSIGMCGLLCVVGFGIWLWFLSCLCCGVIWGWFMWFFGLVFVFVMY